MKIYLHTKRKNSTDWDNAEFELAQIPALGEYLVISPDSEYFLVKLVLHTPYEKGAFAAEVWAVESSQAEAMQQALGEVVDQ